MRTRSTFLADGESDSRYLRLKLTWRDAVVSVAVLVALVLWLAPLPRGGGHEGRHGAVNTQLATLDAALEQFHGDLGRYPTKEEGLSSLVQPPLRGREAWQGPYLDTDAVPRDPWGNEFRYRAPGVDGEPYDLLSPGLDHLPGTQDDVRGRPNPGRENKVR